MSAASLVQYWGCLGVGEGLAVLEDMGLVGLGTDTERLELEIVSSRLREELGQAVETLR